MSEEFAAPANRLSKALTTRYLCESAILIAASTILSLLKVFTIPFGGSITIGAMVPMILLSYRWGMKLGFFACAVNGIVQLLVGFGDFSFTFALWLVIADILMEYLIAYALLGLGGAFRNRMRPTPALLLGGMLAIFSRYLVHFIMGFLIWGSYAEWFFTEGAGVSIGEAVLSAHQGVGLAVIYSGVVNSSLMLGEMVVSLILLTVLSRIPPVIQKMH